MLKLLETLWLTTAPDWTPIPYTEDDDSTTEVCVPPTLRSTMSAETAYDLAESAISERDFDAAKGYLQYYHHKTKS
jgi:hypothetical protein